MKTLVALAALFAVATPALAAQPVPTAGEARQVTVRYADLDLSRPAGADAMIARIRQAAEVACSGFSTRELAEMAQQRACLSETMAAAVRKVNAPLVTARFEGPAKAAARLAAK